MFEDGLIRPTSDIMPLVPLAPWVVFGLLIDELDRMAVGRQGWGYHTSSRVRVDLTHRQAILVT